MCTGSLQNARADSWENPANVPGSTVKGLDTAGRTPVVPILDVVLTPPPPPTVGDSAIRIAEIENKIKNLNSELIIMRQAKDKLTTELESTQSRIRKVKKIWSSVVHAREKMSEADREVFNAKGGDDLTESFKDSLQRMNGLKNEEARLEQDIDTSHNNINHTQDKIQNLREEIVRINREMNLSHYSDPRNDEPRVFRTEAYQAMARATTVRSTTSGPLPLDVWASGFTSRGAQSIDGQIGDNRITNYGYTAGVAKYLMPRWNVGIAFSHNNNSTKVGTLGSTSSSSANTGLVHSSYMFSNRVMLIGALGYSNGSITINRWMPESSGFAAGNRSQNFWLFSAGVQRAYDIAANAQIVPYARLTTTKGKLGGYSETNTVGSTVTLKYNEMKTTSQVANIGVSAAYKIHQHWGSITPKAVLDYSHEFSGDGTQTVSYLVDPAVLYNFTSSGAPKNIVKSSLGFSLQTLKNLTVDMAYTYATATSGGYYTNTWSGALRLAF